MKEILINQKKSQRPEMKLFIQRVEASVWRSLGFYKHHYLTESLNPSCKCFLITNQQGEPLAFIGIINTPRKGCPFSMAISRIVVDPCMQGMGLSTKICNLLGGMVKSLSDEDHDFNLYIKTIHSKLAKGLERSNWVGTCFDAKQRTQKDYEPGKYNNRKNRISFCKRYEGEAIDGYQDIMKPIKEMRLSKIGIIEQDLFA